MRHALRLIAATVAVAVGIRLFLGHTYPDYDSLYALIWGDDLASGRSPDLELPFAPAAHPLYLLLGALLSPFGSDAADALVWIVLLTTGALCVGLFELGRALFSWPVGLLAAALFATRVPTLHFAGGAFADLPAAALVVWAAVLEARRPRRGLPVFALLALAGLIRPEAWLFAAAYWLWSGPALRTAALAAAGPLLWLLGEWVITGDPLRPITDKNATVAQVGSRTGLGDAPEAFARDLGNFLQAPALVLAGIGLTLAFMWMRERALLPAAIAALSSVAFLVLAAAGQPLEQRYLMVPAAMACLFAAVALLGWTAGDDRRWRVAGVVGLVALLAVSIPRDGGRLDDLREQTTAGERSLDGLRELARDSGAVQVSTARPLPFVAFYSGERPAALRTPVDAAAPIAAILPVDAVGAELIYRSLPRQPPRNAPDPPPPGWTETARSGGWALFAPPG